MSDPDQLHPDLRALIGTTIHDRYEVVSLLGAGGMGAVFQARHTGLDRDVALKVLHPEIGRDDSISKRFDREATSASRLDHPNCVRVTDFGSTVDGTKYLVMELLAGVELEERLGQPWAAQDMIPIAKQILEGLEHAHHFGIVHRDLKPENVFLTTDYRGEELVKLVDFGIAKLLDEQGAEKLTRAGIVFGTPRYMSPEQAAGGKIDARTDLYAAGLIFYQMLAGQLPFDCDDPAQLLRMQIMAPPPPLPDSVPAELARIVEKLLEKSKMDRYETAREVLDALDAVSTSLAAGPSPSPAAAAIAGAAVVEAVVAGAAVALTSSTDDAGASDSGGRAARSGASWQPASASMSSASAASPSQPKSTQLYAPGLSTGAHASVGQLSTGAHASVGQLSTGAFDSLPGAPVSHAGPIPSTGSHATVPSMSSMPVQEESGDRKTLMPWLAVAIAILLALIAIGFGISFLVGDDAGESSAESSGASEAGSAEPGAGATNEAIEPAAAPAPVEPAASKGDARAAAPRSDSRPSRSAKTPSGSDTADAKADSKDAGKADSKDAGKADEQDAEKADETEDTPSEATVGPADWPRGKKHGDKSDKKSKDKDKKK